MQTRLNEVMVGLVVLISKIFTFIGKNFQTIITQYIKDSKMVAKYKDNNPYTTVKELKSYSPLPKVTIFDKIKVGPSISWTPLSGGGFQPGISVIYSIY
jgi:hypothetical protein